MQEAVRRRWRAGAVIAGLAVSLVATGLAAPAVAAGPVVRPTAVDPCPAPVPIAEVTPGQTGQALTVARGTTPEPFAVEVLGVLPDGIAAGKDLIVAEVSEVPGGDVLSQSGGGIWAGISGSPVYVGDRLLGSVSWGFTGSNSPIVGVTPAADMVQLLTLDGTPAARAAAKTTERKAVTLPKALRRSVEARADAPVPRGALRQLPLPLSVSGLNARRLARLQTTLDKTGRSVVAHAGARRAAPRAVGTFATPEPGGNFASVWSYGDLTVAGIGTTTAVCDGQALAFGHPDGFAGAVGYGANVGTALGIIRDDTFGSFKLANLGDAIGTVDQDRLSGIRAQLGVLPTTVPVTTTIKHSVTGRSREGVTQVATPDLLPDIALFAAWANYDNVFDQIGKGRASSRWLINGTRAGGAAFSVTTNNQWASRFDVAFDPSFDLYNALSALVNQDDEPVTITSVSLRSNITPNFNQYRVGKVEVAVGTGAYRSVDALTVRAGDVIKVRTTLKAFQSSATRQVVRSVRVPTSARGQSGELRVLGGLETASGEEEGCEGDECGSAADASLDDVIDSLTKAPHNNDVVVGLSLSSGEDPGPSTPIAERRVRVGYTVTGGDSVEINVRR